MIWTRTKKFDSECAAMADRHYSRRTVGSPQFMPPGQTIVLKAPNAVFGWWRPDPSKGFKQMNGLEGWTCTIFRNESTAKSSEMILEAEFALTEFAGADCGPDGMITYVWDKRVRSSNPGCCFKIAGWKVAGKSADKRKTLFLKPYSQAGLVSL